MYIDEHILSTFLIFVMQVLYVLQSTKTQHKLQDALTRKITTIIDKLKYYVLITALYSVDTIKCTPGTSKLDIQKLRSSHLYIDPQKCAMKRI